MRRGPQPRRLSTLCANGLLVLAGCAIAALAVVGLEAGARTVAPNYLLETRGLHVFSSRYGWASRKNTAAVLGGRRYTINAHGHRGRLVSGQKPPGVQRLLILGDSIAFGADVSDDETFAHWLDTRQNGIEVVNLAVQGYGTDQELLKLMDEGPAYQPDMVLLAHCLANDLAEATLPVSLYDGTTPKPRFRLVGGELILEEVPRRAGWLQSANLWLSDNSHLHNRLFARETLPGDGYPHWLDRYQQALSDEDYAVGLNVALVREMRTLCQRRGVPLVVALFPNRSSYRVKLRIVRKFLDRLAGAGVTPIDMAERFRRVGLGFWKVASDEVGHLQPRGHAIAGEVLERELLGLRASLD